LGRAKSKKLKDLIRGHEFRRKQEIIREIALKLQTQIVADYVSTHNMLARKTEIYPLTEKVFTGNPEALTNILVGGLTEVGELQINPYDYPEGLVL